MHRHAQTGTDRHQHGLNRYGQVQRGTYQARTSTDRHISGTDRKPQSAGEMEILWCVQNVGGEVLLQAFNRVLQLNPDLNEI